LVVLNRKSAFNESRPRFGTSKRGRFFFGAWGEEVVQRQKLLAAATVCAVAMSAAPGAYAQLRIVSYNTATANPTSTPPQLTARAGISTILAAIGAEVVNGIAKPIDVLLLQEQFSMAQTTQSFVEILNDLYDPVHRTLYARSVIDGDMSDSLGRAGRPGLVYNTQTVKLLNVIDDGIQGEIKFGNVGTSTTEQPRSTLRYQLRPVGYDASADFYAYNSHWVSDTGAIPNSRRLAQAESTRTNADELGQGAHIIYAGDFNIQTSSGDAYQHMISSGNGQAFDPLAMPGSWHQEGNEMPGDPPKPFKGIHTQSPATVAQYSGQTLGGLDDRFDFQLVTGELLDSEGMSYIAGSYRAFGNNGTHVCCNSPITTGTGAAPEVLVALMQASDHLPVVADYMLPAKMQVQVAAIPSLVELGSIVPIDVIVTNIAPALVVHGADELDYTLSVAGALTGGVTATDLALGGGNTHQVYLDASTLGALNGTIHVSAAASQGAANALFSLPISFEVVAGFLEADFNRDGAVDAQDLAVWSTNFGLAGAATRAHGDADLDEDVDGDDFLFWQRQLTIGAAAIGSQTVVPEPTTALLLAALALGLVAARATTRVSRHRFDAVHSRRRDGAG